MSLAPPRTLATRAELLAWVARLESPEAAHSPIAVDTESDSLHRYREKVCLLQMTALDEDVIIDPLAIGSLEPLANVFFDHQRIKIFHDAGYDLICLYRDFELPVRGLFDTMLASRLVGVRQFGLAAILQERFGFIADKRYQRSDWSRRPLTVEQLSYARYDTHYLPRLMRLLTDELQQAGRLAWATEEFARLPEVVARAATRPPGPDFNGFWRIQGARSLAPEAGGRLRALYAARERLAEALDRPAFKVINDFVLLELAQHPPTSLADLQPRPGLRRGGILRYGKELLAALATAKPLEGGPPKGVMRRRRTGRMLDSLPKARYEHLRAMRRTQADLLGLDPEVVLGNAALEELARKPPATAHELCQRPDFAGWRADVLVEPIMVSLAEPLLELDSVPAEADEKGGAQADTDDDTLAGLGV